LTVQLAVDSAVLNASVPVFLLQPLLENAIEHGKQEDECLRIALNAGRERDTLHIAIADNGLGVRGGVAVREGVGLGNTRARLRHLYGSGATVHLEAAHGMPGVRVDIRLPFRETLA
jgi:LytS/YehU family sensor histidine kinase